MSLLSRQQTEWILSRRRALCLVLLVCARAVRTGIWSPNSNDLEAKWSVVLSCCMKMVKCYSIELLALQACTVTGSGSQMQIQPCKIVASLSKNCINNSQTLLLCCAAYFPSLPRTHAGILDAASSITALLRACFPLLLDKLPRESAFFSGPRPLLLDGLSTEELSILLSSGDPTASQVEFGAHQVRR